MLSGEPRVPVTTLRDAVRQAVERTSSHAVAREVGMSAPSLRDFVAGSEPRAATVRKLTVWYIRRHEEGGGHDVDVETAEAAFALLIEHIPAQYRDETQASFLDWLEGVSKSAGVLLPSWINKMREV
jgi:hypothetical protein